MHHHMDMAQPASSGLLQWLSGYGYAPHSGCFLGDHTWIAAYVAANWVIALAYILIALLIAQRMQHASHIPRTVMGMALLGIFVTCAGGHFLEGFTTILWPGYRLETLWHWATALPAYLFLANHKRFSLIVEGPHMIAETREELARKNSELSALYEQVKQLDEVKSQFFANVSHELRTPLALILGPVERMLTEDTLDETQRRRLELVARNARTVLKHVNDLLDVAKMEAGKMQMHYAEVDFAHLARVTAANFDAVVEQRQLSFTLEAPETLMAQVDPEKMQRVLLNLLSNAVKFVPQGGAIRCVLSSRGDRMLLQVQDNGPGVPPEMRATVFERFRQVDGGATRNFGGTGLGLAIVKDFIDLHGGSVGVTEAPGGGALFRVEMPLFAPSGARVATEASRGVADDVLLTTLEELRVTPQEEHRVRAKAHAGETGKPLVLVVEDNRDMSRFIVDTLTPDFRTETAYDGQEGLERALELRPDLILSDIMMPRKSGDQMVTDLRRHPEMETTPIVLLTAKADDELRIRLLEHGAQDYLHKPFAAAELRVRVGNQVAMKRARQVLQEELASSLSDVALLAEQLAERNHALQAALDAARAARNLAEAATLQEHRRNEQLIEAIREAHHRLKNNLQVVTSLLEMRMGEADAWLAVSSMRQSLLQIKVIAMVHDLLSHDSPIGEVDAAVVLRRLASLLSDSLRPPHRPVRIRVTGETALLPTRAATSLSLIVTELVGNALRHSHLAESDAGRGGRGGIVSSGNERREDKRTEDKRNEDERREGDEAGARAQEITIDLHRSGDRLALTVEDPGPGFPEGFDPLQQARLGLELVITLVASDLQGEILFGNLPDEFDNHMHRGRVEIVFPAHPAAA